MIIDDHAQMGGHGLGMQGQERAGGEVDDPEIIDAGGFKRFGGAGDVLAQEIPPALGVEVILLQPPVDGGEGGQGGIGLFPLAVEEFDGNTGKGPDAFQDPTLLVWGEPAGLATVGPEFGFEALEAPLLEEVIPVFESAFGDELR